MQPDYSRQTLLKEVGAQGQAAMAGARILVIGAGGLGTPVLQYLAGAGVGCLGIVDDDVLQASNLHRQPLYHLQDTGEGKALLAQRALQQINPAVKIEVHSVRFDAGNACELLRSYDIAIDCTDNFRAKFLINDAAVLLRKPAIFASVYQFEGQLQVYKPNAAHACLRCLWPEAIPEGTVGNCAEAGVLGPVPGTFGALQALLALKILLGMQGQLDGELLLMDFMNFSQVKLKAPRRPACLAPDCALIKDMPAVEQDIDVALASLAQAAQQGLETIDIRTQEEFTAHPSGARHVPMHELLNQSDASFAGRRLLLVCASGRRSGSAARSLRLRGVAAHSLVGGLPSLQS